MDLKGSIDGLTGIILAGGTSQRMGEDKAFLRGGVARLADELRKAGCIRVIVMCGTKERIELFDEECIIDSHDDLASSIKTVLNGLKGEVQLVPCDAVLADSSFLSSITGVPIDEHGERQHLMARIALPLPEIDSKKVSDLFDYLPSCEGGIKASNVNTPDELKGI
jgi:molybdopterin-guanine dinucleotide biosynthesis protein A